jgi:hypothetical protein
MLKYANEMHFFGYFMKCIWIFISITFNLNKIIPFFLPKKKIIPVLCIVSNCFMFYALIVPAWIREFNLNLFKFMLIIQIVI